MSNNKYKVLWLDDFFVPIQNDCREDLKESIEIFQEDIEDAIDYGVSVKGVSNYEEFEAELPNINSYHGVVFDLRGMTKGGEVTDQTVHDALNLLRRSNKDIPIYIYSSNSAMEKFELTINDIKSQGRAFPKGKGVDDLVRKIISDMDNLYHFYIGHDECIHLFNENFLHPDLRPIMDELLRSYSDSVLKCDPYNRMRKILENMLQSLNDIRIIKVNGDADKKFNSRVNYICVACPKKIDKERNEVYDYHNPLVPFSVCNQETKYMIKFLGDMANFNSHFITKHSDSFLGYYYDLNVIQATYSAFFAVMKWYYTFMHTNYPHS